MVEGQQAKQQMLWNMVTDFIQTYKNTISGKYDSKRLMASSGNKQDLSGGAKIKMNFYNLYQTTKNVIQVDLKQFFQHSLLQ